MLKRNISDCYFDTSSLSAQRYFTWESNRIYPSSYGILGSWNLLFPFGLWFDDNMEKPRQTMDQKFCKPENITLLLYLRNDDISLHNIYIYTGLGRIGDEQINAVILLQSFFWGGTVIKNGWYLQTQLLLYIIFYFSFKKEGTDQRKLWLLCGFTCIYYIACNLLKMSYTWYVSMPLFVVGML